MNTKLSKLQIVEISGNNVSNVDYNNHNILQNSSQYILQKSNLLAIIKLLIIQTAGTVFLKK